MCILTSSCRGHHYGGTRPRFSPSFGRTPGGHTQCPRRVLNRAPTRQRRISRPTLYSTKELISQISVCLFGTSKTLQDDIYSISVFWRGPLRNKRLKDLFKSSSPYGYIENEEPFRICLSWLRKFQQQSLVKSICRRFYIFYRYRLSFNWVFLWIRVQIFYDVKFIKYREQNFETKNGFLSCQQERL